jgi:hypothetical protein
VLQQLLPVKPIPLHSNLSSRCRFPCNDLRAEISSNFTAITALESVNELEEKKLMRKSPRSLAQIE